MTTATFETVNVLSANTLIGDNVVNTTGENLGEIKELMIDPQTGHVAYAVLSFGGFLGLGDKLFAIPFKSLTLRPDHEDFVLDVTKERLENAPGFDKDDWPTTTDRAWGTEIHSYYGVSPYWQTTNTVR